MKHIKETRTVARFVAWNHIARAIDHCDQRYGFRKYTMLRDTDWVNAKTGETGQAFLIIKGKKYPRGMEFMTMFSEGWSALASWQDEKGRRLTVTEWRVLAGLMAHLQFENVIEICQATLAEQLRIAAPNVSNAMKRLSEAGFIERSRDEEDRRRTIYRLNPWLGWRGKAPDWQAAIQGRSKPVPTRGADEDIDAFLAGCGTAGSASKTEQEGNETGVGDSNTSPFGDGAAVAAK